MEMTATIAEICLCLSTITIIIIIIVVIMTIYFIYSVGHLIIGVSV